MARFIRFYANPTAQAFALLLVSALIVAIALLGPQGAIALPNT